MKKIMTLVYDVVVLVLSTMFTGMMLFGTICDIFEGEALMALTCVAGLIVSASAMVTFFKAFPKDFMKVAKN